MKREPGYYWVRIARRNNSWEPAEYCKNGEWAYIGDASDYFEPDEVGERIVRQEK